MAPQRSMFPRQQDNTEIIEETFSTRSVLRCYKQDQLAVAVTPRLEMGSNTSTAALRVVGGDEKGTQCLGHPVRGGYKYGDLALQFGGVSNLRQ
jgi:hypothetical protein